MASPSCALRTNRCATAASSSCRGTRDASTASGWRRSITWSMRARKKSSVAGQANMAVKLPENNRHWTTNWEFRVSYKPPTTNVYAGHEDFSGTTKYCDDMVPTYNGPTADEPGHTLGGYAQQIVVDERYVLRVLHPESQLAAVAPLLCAGITTYSPLRHWQVGPGRKVGV